MNTTTSGSRRGHLRGRRGRASRRSRDRRGRSTRASRSRAARRRSRRRACRATGRAIRPASRRRPRAAAGRSTRERTAVAGAGGGGRPPVTVGVRSVACTVPASDGLSSPLRRTRSVATSATAATASDAGDDAGDAPRTPAPAVAPPVTAIGGVPRRGCGIGHGRGARRRLRGRGPGLARAPGREGETTMLTGGPCAAHAVHACRQAPNAAWSSRRGARLLHRAGHPGRGHARMVRGDAHAQRARAAPRAAPGSRG